MASRPIASLDSPASPAEPIEAPVAGDVDPPELTEATRQGLADMAAGHVTPHAQVKAWLQRWGKGDPGPAPRPWNTLG